jgi:protein phosphatase
MSRLTISAASHIGLKRKENQDSHAYYSPENGSAHKKGILLAIADGMGGHSGGSIASKIAIDTLMEEYYKDYYGGILESLEKAFLKANDKITATGQENIELKGLGSTMTAVVFQGEKIYYAHVGDSRGYTIYDNKISQFTEDHSYVASLVKAGVITEEEAETHPEKNIITRAIGIGPDLKVDVAMINQNVKKGQYVLLCCDGLHGLVPNEEISNAVYEYKKPDVICERLINKANENGGPDNITVMVARVDSINIISGLTSRLINLVR